ncbi:MAG: hypothetical protein U9O64_11375 [Campylobacterota bacterium]|nr:hypothetical protein [Campylobacterota bacterium]
MRHIFNLIILYTLGAISLYAKEESLGGVLKGLGEKQPLIKPETKKAVPKKKSRFIFKDTYNEQNIGAKEEGTKRAESYEYANKSRFKFKINDGSPQSNMMGGQYGVSSGMSGGGIGGGSGSQGGGGRR